MANETVHEEWLLTFTARTDRELFSSKFRQQVVYTPGEGGFPYFAWFGTGLQAEIARSIAEDEGAQDVKLQRRTVTTVCTEWEDVP